MIWIIIGIIYVLGILPVTVILRLLDADEEAVFLIVILWPILAPVVLAFTLVGMLSKGVSSLADKIVNRIRRIGRK